MDRALTGRLALCILTGDSLAQKQAAHDHSLAAVSHL